MPNPSPHCRTKKSVGRHLISLVVFVYLVMQEIQGAMGKGALFKLFFEAPRDKSKPPSLVQ